MRCLQRVEAGVDRRHTLPLKPAVILLVESAIELGKLVEEKLEIRLHSSTGSLESGVVVVGGGIGFQDWIRV